MPKFFGKTNFDFVSIRWICITISAVIIVAGIVTMAIRGPNWSIDFRGGMDMQVRFAQQVSDGDVRAALSDMNVGEVKSIAALGQRSDILIRLKVSENTSQTEQQVVARLQEKFPGNSVEVRNVELVGPKVGSELRNQAMISAVVAIILLLIYITWRFKIEYAIGGIVALFHDVMITIAFLAFFNYEFSLSVLAALLTILGFSLNDTIVIYDRIRENLKKLRSMNLGQIMNLSINETLSRTIITSLTVFFTVLVLFIFGGPVLRGFAFSMLVGVIAGSYSTIFIASPVVLEWAERKAIKGNKR